MSISMKAAALAVSSALALVPASNAAAQVSGDVIRIGLTTDLSGVYSDIAGQGGLEAVKMAIADFGGSVQGKKIEFIYSDHLNKADVAANKVREWIDQQGVDVVLAGVNSAVFLSVARIAAEKKKPFIAVGSGTARVTNEECNPYSIHYGYDTVALAKGTGASVVKQGGKNWYFLTADYTFGHSLEGDTTRVIKAAGGNVVGSVKHPLSAPDFSSFLLQAQSSKAQILGLADAGGDMIGAIKAANEFGVTKTMKLAGLIMFVTDVHSLGLPLTQGMYTTDSWYWDQSPESRAWSKRYYEMLKKMPTGLHASAYSATLHYLNAVKAAASDDGDKVMTQMKKAKVNDMYVKNGYVRDDGRMVHDMYLMQVKAPSESKYPWDYYKVVQRIPGEEAFTTKAESKCSLWK